LVEGVVLGGAEEVSDYADNLDVVHHLDRALAQSKVDKDVAEWLPVRGGVGECEERARPLAGCVLLDLAQELPGHAGGPVMSGC
jgi:hypothetical protein